jgi:hypothetical protein
VNRDAVHLTFFRMQQHGAAILARIVGCVVTGGENGRGADKPSDKGPGDRFQIDFMMFHHFSLRWRQAGAQELSAIGRLAQGRCR